MLKTLVNTTLYDLISFFAPRIMRFQTCFWVAVQESFSFQDFDRPSGVVNFFSFFVFQFFLFPFFVFATSFFASPIFFLLPVFFVQLFFFRFFQFAFFFFAFCFFCFRFFFFRFCFLLSVLTFYFFPHILNQLFEEKIMALKYLL